MTATAPLSRSAIEQLIPHADGMCLLDGVTNWDEQSIHCRSAGHRDPGHVLRREGKLAALHLIEYGAQAMAIHGGLLAATDGTRARDGFLALVRTASFAVARLDDIPADLDISATRLIGGEQGWTYEFSACAEGRSLARGRVAVMFRPEVA